MKWLSTSLGIILLAAAPAIGQEVKPEDELRAEIARLKASLARAEALLERLEAASPPEVAPSVQKEPVPVPVEIRRSPPMPPALNTPPRLPASNAASYRKELPRLDILLQSRFDHSADPSHASTFFLRKAEVGIKGHIAKSIDFSIEIDPARAPVNDPFRRTYVRLSHLNRLHVKVGLEKAPIGVEELTSSGEIPFVERSEVTDKFASSEQMGVFLESGWNRWLLQASVTNGGRRLLRDDNRHKDFTARAVWAASQKLSLGVSTVHGREGPAAHDRLRYNVEAKYGADNLRGAQAEYFRAKDGEIWSHAFYVSAFWAAPARTSWLTHVQPVARYEFVERGDHDPFAELRVLTLGASFLFLEQQAKLQINWLTNFGNGNPRRDELRTQYSVEF